MKKSLGVLLLLSLTSLAFGTTEFTGAVPPTHGGTGATGSYVDLEIKATVVDVIAVNQASPIDFGNLRRGMMGEHTALHKGKLLVDSGTKPSILTFEKVDNIDLLWEGENGTDGNGTKTDITGITLTGAFDATNTKEMKLEAGDGIVREVGAKFTAAAAGNLDTTQKLGSYLGKVRVTASVN